MLVLTLKRIGLIDALICMNLEKRFLPRKVVEAKGIYWEAYVRLHAQSPICLLTDFSD